MKQVKITISYDEDNLGLPGEVVMEGPKEMPRAALAIVRGALLTLADKLHDKLHGFSRN